MGSRLKRSKMPSHSSAPQPDLVFFIDRDLGKKFPAVLRAGGLSVEAYDDHYPDDSKVADHVWIRFATNHGWVCVSHDASIRYSSRSREVILELGGRLIITKGHAPNSALAENFVRSGAAIKRFVRKQPAPWIAKLYRHPKDASRAGTVDRWFPSEAGDIDSET
jgi:hypothetical protein